MTVYLGCYTDSSHPGGLKCLELDPATGKMSVVAEYPVTNAIYQALSPDGKLLYTCSGEGLASFRIAGNRLEKIDSVTIGNCVCHVAVMPDGKCAVWADYLGGFAGSVEVDEGHFGATVGHHHSGSGPNLPRQDKAHCHQALPTPDGKSYCVVDLGLDEIVTYPGGIKFGTEPKGAGPRHLLFHPNGKFAFLVYELGNLVSSFRWSAADGFKLVDTLPTLDQRDTKTENRYSNLASAIRFTPDMTGLVVSNRGENSLVAYGINAATGGLSFKARTLLAGNWPRDFIFVSPSLALVAMERSGEVLSLRFYPATGRFSPLASLTGIFRPVALTLNRSGSK